MQSRWLREEMVERERKKEREREIKLIEPKKKVNHLKFNRIYIDRVRLNHQTLKTL